MKLTFIGAGSAFNHVDGQTNLVLTSERSGKHMLIDCGTMCWSQIQKQGLPFKVSDFDAVYVSHLHADHVGGLEQLCFCRYFMPGFVRPKLFCNAELMVELWEHSLRGGLESIQGKTVTLSEYFDCRGVDRSGSFQWEEYDLTPVQTVHVMSGYHIKYSYGLMIKNQRLSSRRVFLTTDVQFCPHQIFDFYAQADVIIQDCETSPFKSGVHAHIADLSTLPEEVRMKMIMCHYQVGGRENELAHMFKSFAKAGDVIYVEELT